jgi:hypothetical protein
VLVISMSSLIMLIIIHVAVFGLIRWMYPMPVGQAAPPRVRFSPPPPSFTEPPQMKQEVNVPTYAPPVSMEAPREEGGADTGKASGSAAERPAWLVAVDPKTLE